MHRFFIVLVLHTALSEVGEKRLGQHPRDAQPNWQRMPQARMQEDLARIWRKNAISFAFKVG